MRIAICTYIRNNDRYLNEFINYYKSLGIDYILINNISTIPNSYLNINDDNVEIVDYRNKDILLSKIFENSLSQLKDSFDWVFYVNLDEYFVSPFQSIKEYLSQECFIDEEFIPIPRRVIKDNNIVHYNSESLNSKFTEFATMERCEQYSRDNNEFNDDIILSEIPNYTFEYIINTDIKDFNILDFFDDTTQQWIGYKSSDDNNVYLKYFKFKSIEEYCQNYSNDFFDKTNDELRYKYTLKDFFNINDLTEEKKEFIRNDAIKYRTDKAFWYGYIDLAPDEIKDKFDIKVALCTLIRRENDYIEEFINHYKNLGIDNIILYDNNFDGEDNIMDIIFDDVESGFVILKDKRNCNKDKWTEDGYQINQQMIIYQECLEEFGKDYDWICYFDCDEYLNLDKNRYNDIKDFLNCGEFENCDLINCQSKVFFGLNKIYNENKPLNERFTINVDLSKFENKFLEKFRKNGEIDCSLLNKCLNWQIKSILHTQKGKNLAFSWIFNPHIPKILNTNEQIRLLNKKHIIPYYGAYIFNNKSNKNFLKHFTLKSLEEKVKYFYDNHICHGEIQESDIISSWISLTYDYIYPDELYDFLMYFFPPNINEKVINEKNKILSMEKDNPLLSVVIPCYNCRNTIERLLNSLEMQTFKDFEVIIIDDRSPDNFTELVEPYKSKMNISIIPNYDGKHGPNIGRNIGINLAKGEWITFIDADDEIPDNDVFEVVKYNIDSNPEFVKIEGRNYSHTDKDYNMYYWYNIHGKFFKKSFLMKYFLNYDEDINYNEDIYFMGLINNYIDATKSQWCKIERPLYRMISTIGSHTSNDPYFFEHTYDTYLKARYLPVLRVITKFPEIRDSRLGILYEVFGECYFQYQGFLYRQWKEKDKMPDEVKETIKRNRQEVQELLAYYDTVAKLSTKDILEYFKNNPDRYHQYWDFSESWTNLEIIPQESLFEFLGRYSEHEKFILYDDKNAKTRR